MGNIICEDDIIKLMINLDDALEHFQVFVSNHTEENVKIREIALQVFEDIN